MILFRRILLTVLVGLALTISKKANAQCNEPAWSYCIGCYVATDIVSHNDKDWQLGSTGQGWRTPGSITGPAHWVEISDPCASSTAPEVSATVSRAIYCTTAFGVGYVDNNGGEALTSLGFVYGTSSNPTLSNANVLEETQAGVAEEFEGLMANLSTEETYYVRTYATNSLGTTYGDQSTFTTRASADCSSDCDLACDISDASLLDPGSSNLVGVIPAEDTICITADVATGGAIDLYGMIKLCNGATMTLNGQLDVVTSQTPGAGTKRGQVVYEGCNEMFDFDGGSYKGDLIAGETGVNDPEDHEPTQMISYCSTCDNTDKSQFFTTAVDVHLWNATCRPTTTLIVSLPVELSSFSASNHEVGVIIEWTTASEINNSHFEIQSSEDGINWYSIGVAQGAGNSTDENNYAFIDNDKGEGSRYYRLNQIDFDGTENLSNLRHFSFDGERDSKTFIAFQNRNNQIEIQAKFNGMGEARLFDTRGRVVELKTFISTNKSGTTLTFDETNLSEGVYFVQIKSGNALLGQKVQVIK